MGNLSGAIGNALAGDHSPVKPIVIFGQGTTADLAHFYLTHDSDREIAAFSVDGD